MKYAMVFTTTAGYMPGTNGILNALEHYGMAPYIDVYVIQVNFELPEEYKEQWPDVAFETLDPSIWPESHNAGWYCRFAPPARAIELLDTYDAVQLAGADVCPVSNYIGYFHQSAHEQKPVLSTNEQGCADFSRMTPKGEHPYIHTWMVPYADIPCIVSKSQKELLQLNLDYQNREDCRLSWMDGLNYAIRDLGTEVICDPGQYWVFNLSSQGKIQRENDMLFYQERRLNTFHRKYWLAGVCMRYLAPANPNCQHNHLIFNQMWNYFNRECRVKWTEGIDQWDGNVSLP